MSTILGQTLNYALEDATNTQKQINDALAQSHLDARTKSLITRQTKLLDSLRELCERVY